MLGIEVEDQDAAMLFAECGCEVDAGGGLATAAFLVGYRDGTLRRRAPDETKMPLKALSAYRDRFGVQATPELMVYDRGGYAKATLDELARQGVKQIGVQPKGKVLAVCESG